MNYARKEIEEENDKVRVITIDYLKKEVAKARKRWKDANMRFINAVVESDAMDRLMTAEDPQVIWNNIKIFAPLFDIDIREVLDAFCMADISDKDRAKLCVKTQ